METPPLPTSGAAADADAESLLEQAYADAAELVDEDEGNCARILDSAYEQFCRLGVQKSTMDDVARRAGVSRITVYRRFSTKDALVEQVVRREFRRYFEEFREEMAQAETVTDRVVLGFVSTLRASRSNPLIGGLLAPEPDLVAASPIENERQALTLVRRFLAGLLRHEQHAGNVAAEVDVDLVAELMVRISSSFLTIPTDLPHLEDDDHLADLARRYLAPMLHPPPPLPCEPER
ncbi:TetR/AcrR family transcriptional regulator [Actinocorallia aurea]